MKSKLKLPKLQILIVALLLAILGVLVLYGAIMVHMRNSTETTRMAMLITSSMQILKQPAVADPLTGRSFIPSARLVLPATQSDTWDIQTLYYHQPSFDGQLEEVSIASKFDISSAESRLLTKTDMDEMFEEVPKLQACARGIKLTFAPIEDQDTAATKTLADGRNVYMYTEPLCENSSLLDYIKSIESY